MDPENTNRKPIYSFRDLEVYQDSYKAMLEVAGKILPKLPPSEKYDLKDQLSRSTKAIPRLIAEGFAKKHQKLGFQKYLDDAMAEVNETIVSLEQTKDIYHVEPDLCKNLIERYGVLSKRIYKLASVWTNFTDKRYKS
jgi:four helix bundle protein